METKNTHTKPSRKNRFWFTLVELIVVISILAILGTIGFISLQWFSGSARDSARVSDMSNLKKAFELTHMKTGYYPTPTNGTWVTFSGWTVWSQGTIGDSVLTILNAAGFKLSKKPTDPKYVNIEYTYSLLENKKEYQIASVMEDSNTAFWQIITPVYATDSITSYLIGNYNGLIAKTKTGSTSYYLTIPTIVLANLSGSMELSNPATQSGNLVMHKKGNIPSSYTAGWVFSTSPSITFNALENSDKLTNGSGIVAYSTSGTLDSTWASIMMSNLYAIYNTSNIKSDTASVGQVSSLVSGGSGSIALVSLYNGSVKGSVGGSSNLSNLCTSWTYNTGSCQIDNTQTLTISDSFPNGCIGGVPLVSQSCTYTPPTVWSIIAQSWSETALYAWAYSGRTLWVAGTENTGISWKTTNSMTNVAVNAKDGRLNVTAIKGSDSTLSLHPAVKYCDDLVWAWYSDWYLPAQANNTNASTVNCSTQQWELQFLYCQHKWTWSQSLLGFTTVFYWSSMHDIWANGMTAQSLSFNGGLSSGNLKTSSWYAQCIRVAN